MVLEDDAKLVKNFNHKLIDLLIKHNGSYEIMFLHYNPYPQFMKPELFFEYQDIKVEEWSVERSRRENMGSTAGYVLSREGARNLLRSVEKYGCQNAIDWVMFKSPRGEFTQRIVYTTPMLVHANCFQSAQGTVDTDIQNVFDSLSYSNNDEWDKDEYNYVLSKVKDSKHIIKYSGSLQTLDIGVTMTTKKSKNPIDINNNIYIFDIKELSTYKSLFKTKLAEYYTTNQFIYSIPHRFIDEDFQKDKVWGDGYLNPLKPF